MVPSSAGMDSLRHSQRCIIADSYKSCGQDVVLGEPSAQVPGSPPGERSAPRAAWEPQSLECSHSGAGEEPSPHSIRALDSDPSSQKRAGCPAQNCRAGGQPASSPLGSKFIPGQGHLVCPTPTLGAVTLPWELPTCRDAPLPALRERGKAAVGTTLSRRALHMNSNP